MAFAEAFPDDFWVGFWSRFVAGRPVVPEVRDEHRPATFAVDEASVPPSVFGLTSYASPVAPSPRIDRRSALQVPAVKRSQELIATTLSTLPIDLLGPDRRKVSRALFEQPEKDRPRSVTMAETYADLLHDKHAWWLIVESEWNGYPRHVRRLDPRAITVQQDNRVFVTRAGHHGQYTEWVPDDQLIHFESPNEPLLVAGARAIRTCLMLDDAARRHAEGAPPLDYFTPADGVDPADDDEIAEILEDWQTSRQARSTGYVPAALRYNSAGWNPEQLQMAEARQHAVLEIARCAGVDPEDLGVSTTSRTYFNAFDRKQARIQDTLRGYMLAVEERLSMPDVTPRGYVAKTNLSDFLRSDDLTRFQTYEAGLRVGAYADKNEIRDAEGKPPLEEPTTPAAPLRVLPATENEDAASA
ncbi:MAG TPA: phage portal protein [Nocardioides sp.]|uniref:phage portal protein n=1 Tax=Nocardioides sp. TaxID=35761 RepID=UPI002ED94123